MRIEHGQRADISRLQVEVEVAPGDTCLLLLADGFIASAAIQFINWNRTGIQCGVSYENAAGAKEKAIVALSRLVPCTEN